MSTVSIILPVYNRAATLERCVRSILAQTFTDWELIAVDDGSSDNSVAVLEGFADPRIRVLRHERNQGPSAARNTGLRTATGEFIALIDSDDEWLPEKLATQLAALNDPALNADLCCCSYYVVSDGTERTFRHTATSDWRTRLHLECPLGSGTTLLVRRKCVETVGYLDEDLKLYEDWDWVLRLTQQFQLTIVEPPLARIFAGGARPPERVAVSAHRFLEKHDSEFARLGDEYRRRIRAKHFENVAANAFEARFLRLGVSYLLKSFATFPRQNPLRLAALVLAPIDAIFGTSLIQRGAEWRRRLADSAS